MSESWSQRMAAAVKKWGGRGPDQDGRYEAARPLTDLSAYGYIKKVEKVAQACSRSRARSLGPTTAATARWR